MSTVLILANNSDGLYGFRKELLTELLKKYRVVCSVPNDGRYDELRAMGCKIIETDIDRRGMNPVTDIKLFNTYRGIIKKEKPDLVITYTIKPNIYGGMASRLARAPYAANITGLGTAFQKKGALRTLVTIMYRASLKTARVVFFENEDNLQTMLTAGCVPEKRCKVLSGAGVNLQHYIPQPYPAEQEPVRFLFVARVMKEKGTDELLSAMRRLRAEGENCVLDILGDCEEDYTDILRRASEEGWLNYHGYVKDVRPYIAASHCFVLPSWHEGMANTNLECAANARPVITSDIPGCREAVVNGESGFLCRPQDAESLYNEMKRFIHLDASTREAMGLRGRRHMEECFDKQKVVEDTLNGLLGGMYDT